MEPISGDEIRQRYPTLRVEPEERGAFERNAGFAAPEIAVRASAELAQRYGATLLFEAPMGAWSASSSGVVVTLEEGTRLRGDVLVLALGPWCKDEMARAGVAIRLQRNVQAWFRPATNAYRAPSFPAYLLDRTTLPAPLYGMPDAGDGVKAAFHGYGPLADADSLDRTIGLASDVEPIAQALDGWMPGAAAAFFEAQACAYALTPDEHFIIDRHPQYDNVILCGGFSGHGFKFASVVGEIVADLALDGTTKHDVGFLRLSRFGSD